MCSDRFDLADQIIMRVEPFAVGPVLSKVAVVFEFQITADCRCNLNVLSGLIPNFSEPTPWI